MEHRNPRAILRLQRCPRCGYDLAGLPDRHRCPECGFEYDPTMFAVYGWESVERLSLVGRLLIGAWWERVLGTMMLLFLVGIFVYQVYMLLKAGRPPPVFLIVILIVLVGQVVRISPHARKSEGAQRGSIQLFFTPEGASRRRGPGELRLIPWQRYRKVRFRRMRFHNVGENSWRLKLAFPFFKLSLSRPVDVIIECSAREAALIRGEIRRRWRAARATPQEESPA